MDRALRELPKAELENFLEKNLADPATRKQIEILGLYSRDSMSLFDRDNTGPERIPGKWRASYPKQSFIAWLIAKRFGMIN